MAQIPHVQPGEVIRSSFINGLVDQVNALASGAPGPGVSVPHVIGRPLSQARSMITQPAVNLALGLTIDANGASVDPNAPASAALVVIMQSPQASARVNVGSAVDLILAAQGTGPAPLPKPVIVGTTSPSTPIGQPVTIIGDNFDLTASSNTVTFDGVPAGVPNPASKTSLTVTMPVIAGVPKTVQIVVTTPGGGPSAPFPTTVTAPVPGPTPAITSVDTSPHAIGRVGEAMKINGSNFSATASNNTVLFDSVQVVASVASANQLTVTVPNIPGVVLNGPPKLVSLRVKVGSSTSPPSAAPFFVEKV